MPRDRVTRALAICARACLNATTGHGRRWAVESCARALSEQRGAADSTPTENRAAAAMRAVAEVIAARAAA